ncbi:MAG: hypothetical protein ACE5DO_10170 [Desulfobacterales bacterium]
MKTKLAIITIFVLAAVLVGSSALAGGYGYGHRHYFGHHRHYGHHGYYSGGELFIGTMLGFTLGALLAPPPPRPVYIYREYPPAWDYREEYVYIPPARSIQRGPASARGGMSLKYDSCLQTREYTTTIVIEGRTVEAYGTKCLRPDGSWSYGPAQPVPGD